MPSFIFLSPCFQASHLLSFCSSPLTAFRELRYEISGRAPLVKTNLADSEQADSRNQKIPIRRHVTQDKIISIVFSLPSIYIFPFCCNFIHDFLGHVTWGPKPLPALFIQFLAHLKVPLRCLKNFVTVFVVFHLKCLSKLYTTINCR